MPTPMTEILLTGFEPFDGDTLNPSALVAQALDGRTIAGARVRAACLPTAFDASLRALEAAIRDTRPVLALALGQAGGRCDLTVERVAINIDDARIPDNAGARPIDEPIVRGGPVAYFSTLPIKAIVSALRARGLPASVSQTAGTFVCNHVFYALQHRLQGSPVRSGFIHLPCLPEQVRDRPDTPSLPLTAMVAGVAIALEVALTHVGADLRQPGGALD